MVIDETDFKFSKFIKTNKLDLKTAIEIKPLRNVDPPMLCEDTGLVVKKNFQPRVIEATILTE